MYKVGFPCRCSRRACQHRRTFRLHPETYSRRFAFLVCICGGTRWRVDQYRKNQEHSKTNCNCDGLPFQHRRGTRYCWHRSDGSDRFPGDPDFHDYGREI